MNLQGVIERGWPVIPMDAKKRPMISSWKPFQTRLPTEVEINDWLKSNPPAWAAVTGEISGFITLDFDGEPGKETLAKLGIEPHRQSPSGGYHVDFVHPGWKVQTLNHKAKPELGRLFPGTDIKGDGGYVGILGNAGSGEYRWLREALPYALEILPDNLREYLGLMRPAGSDSEPLPTEERSPAAGSKASSSRVSADRLVSDALGHVRVEGRNNAGFWLACQLRDNGYNESDAASQMQNFQASCPPTNVKGHREAYTTAEALASTREAYRTAPREAWSPRRSDVQFTTEEAHQEQVDPESADSDSVSWRELLIRKPDTKTRTGGPLACLANVITALRYAPEWQGVLGFNEFALRVVSRKPAPWAGARPDANWTDNEDSLTADWLQHEGIFVGVEVAGLGVQSVARDFKFHPVRAYLKSLRWDGIRRLDIWLSRYAGAQQSRYIAAVGARWMTAAVARIYEPGIKADCMLILEAKQGALKSTLFKTLAINPDWFTDEIADLGSKDAAMQTAGVWIIEVGELDSMSRAESGKIKAFMSRTTDRFRPPYGKHVQAAPRHCIFGGTVNHANYLKDETGARRFWPVACGKIDIDLLTADRDQLWAEAVVRFSIGEKWWLDTNELNEAATIQQAERYDGDAWDDLISAWLAKPEQRYDGTGHPILPFTSTPQAVTVTDILNHAIGKRQDQWTQGDSNRVARVLKSMDWERFRHRIDGALVWEYRRRGQCS
jgi:predicted P-loop ATPase